MTERWEREVRRLGAEEPPPGLWNEIERRTPGDDGRLGLPPRLGAVLVALVAVAIGSYAVAMAFWPHRSSAPPLQPAPPKVTAILKPPRTPAPITPGPSHTTSPITPAECRGSLPGSVPPSASLPTSIEGSILFTSIDERGEDYDLMVTTPDGSAIATVLDTAERESDGDWSPDGSKIAFVKDGDIWVTDVGGAISTNVTGDCMERTDDEPQWSPDGSRLSFRSNRGGNIAVWIMDADGSNPVEVTGRFSYSGEASWSPDGSRIAYVADATDPAVQSSAPGSGLEVYVANADGTGAFALTSNDRYDQAPAWSPDGTRIALMRSPRSGDEWDVYVVNVDGSGESRLTDWAGYDGEPVWSPDGSMIAFASDRDATAAQLAENRANQNPVAGISIYVMAADGTQVTRVTGTDAGNAFPTDWTS